LVKSAKPAIFYSCKILHLQTAFPDPNNDRLTARTAIFSANGIALAKPPSPRRHCVVPGMRREVYRVLIARRPMQERVHGEAGWFTVDGCGWRWVS